MNLPYFLHALSHQFDAIFFVNTLTNRCLFCKKYPDLVVLSHQLT